MNDDDLTDSLTRAMRAATAADEPSARLTQTLVRTRVAGTRHPYLVPLGATAVVTALTAGGFVVAGLQGSPTSTAAGDAISATPAPTTAAAVASSAPPAVAATSATTIFIISEAATPVPAPTTAAAPTTPPPTPPAHTKPAPATTTVAGPTTTTGLVAATADDTALFAAAASYSVTEKTMTDPTLPDSTSKTRTVTLTHDGSKSYYADQRELTWDELATLPTDTEAFRAAVKEPGLPPNAVEKGLQELVQQESPLPWPQRRAAMAVAMSMPGVAVNQDAKDADGRSAVRVSIETDGMKDSYYFDPVSAHLLEASSFGTTPGSGYQVLYSDWTLTPKA